MSDDDPVTPSRRWGRDGAFQRLRDRLSEGSPDVDAATTFKAIADQIVLRRTELGLSQAELAELCATTQPAIARFERGERPPRIDTLLRVANALDCDLRVEITPRTMRSKT